MNRRLQPGKGTWEPYEDDPGNAAEVQAEKPEEAGAKKFRSGYRQYFSLFRIKKLSAREEYDYGKHGPLVNGSVPEGYQLLDQYWLDIGQTLVYITLNKKTNQTEYLLFEPVLSEFEYELLERLHEDLLDVLVLTTDEIKKDRRRILLDKVYALLNDYGFALGDATLFKLQYYLIRNFIGWSRIDPLMKDTHSKIFPVTEAGSRFFYTTGNTGTSGPTLRLRAKSSTRSR